MKGGSVFSQDKIFVHGDRVKEYLKDSVTKAPVTMEIDITNVCNNSCPGCAGFKDDGITMDKDFAKSLITQISDLGVRGLTFTGGGEPMMNKNFSELVSHAYGLGLDIGVITSGQRPKWVTDSDLENILTSSTWLRVSLDAGSPERYKLTHGLNKNAYNNTLDFISSIVNIKNSLSLPCTIGVGYLTGVGDSVTEREDIMSAIRNCADRGVDYFQLRPMHQSTRKPLIKDSELSDIVSPNKDFKVLASEHKYDLFANDDGKGNRTYDYCHGSRFASVITADGYLTLCCHSRNQDWGRVANLHEMSLEDAWRKDYIETVTKKVNVSNCVPYCRCDSINRSLEMLCEADKNGHKNFL
jgi:MoaA/NifB/PqqE/SkfB family radical SAM enzyme